MNVLFIDACLKEKKSRSLYLANKYIENFCQNDTITHLNIFNDDIKALNFDMLSKREALLSENKLDDKFLYYAHQFANADKIIMATPYWDLSFPAQLKNYIEQICVSGITFSYNEFGVPVGLCKADKLIYITTAGGYIADNNFGFEYIKALCKSLFGIKSFSFFSAEGLDIIGNDVDKILENTVKQFNKD